VNAASRWFAAGALISAGAMAIALVSQHVYDMQPCAWCVLQRLLFVVIGAACVLGLVWRSLAGRMASATLVLLTAAAGVAAALWQYLVAAQTQTCVFTLADRVMAATRLDAWLPEVFQARASCMDAAVRLLGVPYEFYSLALYLLLGAGAVLLLLRLHEPRAGRIGDHAVDPPTSPRLS